MIELSPVSVPWWISPSTPYLDLAVQAEAGTATVECLGSYRTADMPEEPGKEGDRRLVVRFKGVLRTKTEPIQDDAPEATLPFRIVGTPVLSPGEPERYVDAFRTQWLTTGVCPDPRMYERSQRVDEARLYVLRGHDATIFVEAASWSWEDRGKARWRVSGESEE
jgi:hypothetical protein